MKQKILDLAPVPHYAFYMKRTIFISLLFLSAAALLSACHRTETEEQRTARLLEAESLYQTGYTLMIERQYEKAQDTFEKSLAQDDTNAQAWYDLSTTLIELGKYGKAAAAAQHAADHYENATMYDDKIGFRNDALVQVGEAYLWDKKQKQAAAQFQSVYDKDPANRDVLLNIVATYIRCEYPDDALQFCEKNAATYAANTRALAALTEMKQMLQNEKDGVRDDTAE